MTNNCSTSHSQNSECSAGGTSERVCIDGQRYVKRMLEQSPKIAVLACEGGCVKGEVARVAANILAYRLQRESAVRICLGDAATGSSGMLELVKRAPQIIAVEGCPLECGTQIMKYRVPDLKTTVVNASLLYSLDREKYFEIFDMTHTEIEEHAKVVAEQIEKKFFLNKDICCKDICCKDVSSPYTGCK